MSRGPSRLLLAVAAAGLIAGCGGSGSGPGKVLAGSIQYTTCTDWRGGSVADRRRTILALRGFGEGPVGPGNKGGVQVRGPVLDNQRAYNIFQSYCSLKFSSAFKLYKIYERAAAFSGLHP